MFTSRATGKARHDVILLLVTPSPLTEVAIHHGVHTNLSVVHCLLTYENYRNPCRAYCNTH